MNRLICSSAYGMQVGLRIPAADEAAIRTWLPFWWADAGVEPDRCWDIPSAGSARFVVREMELWVGEQSVERVFLHAAVVTLGGQALLLPGRSFAGKSTLTAALLRAGATYGSDEYAVLRADGLVEGYPRPIALRGHEGAANRDPRSYVRAIELGAATMADPTPVAVIAFVRYDAAAPLAFEILPAGQGVLRLLDNALAARRRPQSVLDTVLAATARSRWFSATRDESGPAARTLLSLLNDPDPDADLAAPDVRQG